MNDRFRAHASNGRISLQDTHTDTDYYAIDLGDEGRRTDKEPKETTVIIPSHTVVKRRTVWDAIRDLFHTVPVNFVDLITVSLNAWINADKVSAEALEIQAHGDVMGVYRQGVVADKRHRQEVEGIDGQRVLSHLRTKKEAEILDAQIDINREVRRREVAKHGAEATDEEAMVTLLDQIFAASINQRVEIIDAGTETERRRLELSKVRQERLAHLHQPQQIAAPPPVVDPPKPAVSQYLTEDEIEALAAKAVFRFHGLDPDIAASSWIEWKRMLRGKYEPFVVEEIVKRAAVLRSSAS